MDLELDYSKYTQLKDFYGLAWQVSKKEKITQNEITNTEWTSVVLENTGEGLEGFQLNLKRQGFSKKIKINPILSKERREILQEKYLKEKARIEKIRADFEEQTKNWEMSSKVARSLQVNGFGIYNCDRVISMSDPISLNANFVIDGMQITGSFYLVSNDNSAICYISGYKFNLDAKRNNKILFVRNDKSVAFADSETLANVCANAANNGEKSNVTINLKKSDIKFESSEDLKTLLYQI